MTSSNLNRLFAVFMLLAFSQFSLAAKNYEKFDLNDAPGGLYELDKTHGYITFTYLHQGYSRPWLRFRDIDSTLDLNTSDIEKSKLSVNIKAASIDSGVDIFDEHLRGKNFFKTDEYPEIKFEATSMQVDGADISVTGNLTILETTKPVTLTGVFNKGGLHFRSKKPTLGFSAKTSLIRSEWGLGYATPVVGDQVDIVIEVEYNRKHPLPNKPK